MPFRNTLFDEATYEKLDADLKKKISKNSNLVTLNKGDFLYREEDIPQGIYIVEKGFLKCFTYFPSGKQQILYIAKSKDLLGYQEILCNKNHDLSCISLSDTQVYFLTKELFLELLDEDPSIYEKVMGLACMELGRMKNKVRDLGYKQVKHKVASTLILLWEEYTEQNLSQNHTIYFPLTQEEFASFIGAEPESVNKCLAEFSKYKLIKRTGKKIHLLDMSRLKALAMG